MRHSLLAAALCVLVIGVLAVSTTVEARRFRKPLSAECDRRSRSLLFPALYVSEQFGQLDKSYYNSVV
jgi:hypothetical protein